MAASGLGVAMLVMRGEFGRITLASARKILLTGLPGKVREEDIECHAFAGCVLFRICGADTVGLCRDSTNIVKMGIEKGLNLIEQSVLEDLAMACHGQMVQEGVSTISPETLFQYTRSQCQFCEEISLETMQFVLPRWASAYAKFCSHYRRVMCLFQAAASVGSPTCISEVIDAVFDGIYNESFVAKYQSRGKPRHIYISSNTPFFPTAASQCEQLGCGALESWTGLASLWQLNEDDMQSKNCFIHQSAHWSFSYHDLFSAIRQWKVEPANPSEWHFWERNASFEVFSSQLAKKYSVRHVGMLGLAFPSWASVWELQHLLTVPMTQASAIGHSHRLSLEAVEASDPFQPSPSVVSSQGTYLDPTQTPPGLGQRKHPPVASVETGRDAKRRAIVVELSSSEDPDASLLEPPTDAVAAELPGRAEPMACQACLGYMQLSRGVGGGELKKGKTLVCKHARSRVENFPSQESDTQTAYWNFDRLDA